MYIAFILAPNIVISGNSNGIKSQAKQWRKYLTRRGHTVDEIDVWGHYDWKSYDIIHIFGSGLWLQGFVERIQLFNANLVFSPIIDSFQSPFLYKVSSFVGLKRLRLWSPTYTLRKLMPYFKAVFVRSDYEAAYVNYSLGFAKDNIFKVPVSISSYSGNDDVIGKEDFCLHISSIYQKRKNVIRLIEAAKMFKFKLVLAGSKGTVAEFKPIQDAIGCAENIEVLGFISEEEKEDLYRRAKVFALPSIREGVGIVALDAAVFNCQVVLTNVGGPKEYFNGQAILVNPNNTEEIGRAIAEAIKGYKANNSFKNYVLNNFSEDRVAEKLEQSYTEVTRL